MSPLFSLLLPADLEHNKNLWKNEPFLQTEFDFLRKRFIITQVGAFIQLKAEENRKRKESGNYEKHVCQCTCRHPVG